MLHCRLYNNLLFRNRRKYRTIKNNFEMKRKYLRYFQIISSLEKRKEVEKEEEEEEEEKLLTTTN